MSRRGQPAMEGLATVRPVVAGCAEQPLPLETASRRCPQIGRPMVRAKRTRRGGHGGARRGMASHGALWCVRCGQAVQVGRGELCRVPAGSGMPWCGAPGRPWRGLARPGALGRGRVRCGLAVMARPVMARRAVSWPGGRGGAGPGWSRQAKLRRPRSGRSGPGTSRHGRPGLAVVSRQVLAGSVQAG